MIIVLIRDKERHQDTEGKLVKKRAETGLMHLEAQEHQGLPSATRSEE